MLRTSMLALSVIARLVAGRISDSNSHPAVLTKLHDLAGCTEGICATLAGDAVSPLLAGADQCAQQDQADKIIAAAAQQSADVGKQMIQLAVEYRQVERNTFPIFSVQPNVDRNSVFCQKAPQSPQLNGLVQAQSPNAPPDLFFDPKVQTNDSTVVLGAAPNTFPFGKQGQAATGNAAPSSAGAGSQPTQSAKRCSTKARQAAASSATEAAQAAPQGGEAKVPTTTVFVTVTQGAAAAAQTDAAEKSTGGNGAKVLGFGSQPAAARLRRTAIPVAPTPLAHRRHVNGPLHRLRFKHTRRQAPSNSDLGLVPVSSGVAAAFGSTAAAATAVSPASPSGGNFGLVPFSFGAAPASSSSVVAAVAAAPSAGADGPFVPLGQPQGPSA